MTRVVYLRALDASPSKCSMLPTDIIMADDSTTPIRAALVWLEELDLIVKTEARWPVDHRLHFTLMLDGDPTSGMAEVRAQRAVRGVKMVRCRIVRITTEDADTLRSYQATLDPDDAIELFEGSTTSSTIARRGRLALNDALKNRIRRIRERRP